MTGFVEVVEGVEELLLRALLAGDELDVIDQEEIWCPTA